jgi:hypothetical protein
MAPPADNPINDLYMVGSPFLLKEWSKGSIVNSNGKEINDTSLLLNYDKVNRQVVITMDMKSFFRVDVNNVRSFTVFSPEGDMFFYNKPEISKNNFVQLVSAGKNFSVYKKIVTNVKTHSIVMHQDAAYQGGGYYVVRTAEPANAQSNVHSVNARVNSESNGLGRPMVDVNDSLVGSSKDYEVYLRRTSAGEAPLEYDYKSEQSATADRYVRYEDVAIYYLVENSNREEKVTAKFRLNKASIDNGFGYYDTDKSSQYINDHKNVPLDDNFVKGMADYFNL